MEQAYVPLATLSSLERWCADVGDAARQLYSEHLRASATQTFADCDAAVRDARLWAEEVFWSRACQEGLECAVEGSLVRDALQARAVKGALDDLVRHVETVKPLAAAAAELAVRVAAYEHAPREHAMKRATAEICRHLACAVGQFRAFLSQSLDVTYPADPFIVAEMTAPPVSDLLFDQAHLRLGWTGKMGLGDSWGRAHWSSLAGAAERSRSIGGKIDEALKEVRAAALAATGAIQPKPGAIPRNMRDSLATMTASQVAEEFILAGPLVCRSYAGSHPAGEGKQWSPKSRQQFRSAARLATKFFGLKPFAQLGHSDFAALLEKLIEVPVDHHIPLADEPRTLDEIIEDRKLRLGDGNYRRLGASTISRHLNNLRLLQAWLATALVLPVVAWERILHWPSKDISPKTAFLAVDDIERLFSLPVWTGAQSYRGTPRPGPRVWHSATYWVPVLLWYTGIARDVLCGAQLSAVEKIGANWCLRVTMDRENLSQERGFDRLIPLHPEIIRLGFLHYVRALEDAGHTELFPELRRASGESPGDVFSSRCWRQIRGASPWIPQSLALGAIRDAASKALEDLAAFPEKRCDLFGIRGASEADLRYTRVTPPHELLPVVMMIPVTTSHLEPWPVRLLPPSAMMMPAARQVPRVAARRRQDEDLGRLLRQSATSA